MDEQNFNKTLKSWTIILSIFHGILIVLHTLSGSLNLITASPIILIILFLLLTKNKNILGPIIGIILCILYFISLDIISFVVGLFLISDCFNFFKYIKSLKN